MFIYFCHPCQLTVIIATVLFPQILFISGLGCVIGVERTLRFFFQRHKVKGTTAFFGGIVIVLLGFPIIGMIIESYGFFALFRFVWYSLGLGSLCRMTMASWSGLTGHSPHLRGLVPPELIQIPAISPYDKGFSMILTRPLNSRKVYLVNIVQRSSIRWFINT